MWFNAFLLSSWCKTKSIFNYCPIAKCGCYETLIYLNLDFDKSLKKKSNLINSWNVSF